MRRACALAGSLVFAVSSLGAGPISLASNRAIYDVALERTSGGDVIAAHGRMAIEFRDTCDGWSTTQRLIADMTGSDGSESRTDFFVSAWESRDGRTMRFDVGDTRNGKTKSRQRGSATLDADGAGRAALIAGKPAQFVLPRNTQFPTEQTLGVLRAAQSGGTAFKHIVFQGGDPSNINFSTAAIGKPSLPATLAANRRADGRGLLRNVVAWPVLLSFYPLNVHAESPDYEVATELYADGISGSMSLIYPTYTLRATLVRLEPLAPHC
jgi:hypothetical protein